MLLLAGCSSAPAADWSTPKEALEALESNGFDCTWSGSGDQVTTEDPAGGDSLGFTAIRCDGYGLALIDDAQSWFELIGGECSPEAAQEVVGDEGAATVVVGERYVAIGGEEGMAFPAVAQPQDFIKAFGGEEITLRELFTRACPDTPVPTAS